jgi:hypothetical protein
MKRLLLLFLLLIPSLAGADESHIVFSGNSGYVLDNEAFEQSGNSYFVVGIRFKQNSVFADGAQYLLKYTPTQKSFYVVRMTSVHANPNALRLTLSKNGTVESHVYSTNNYANDTNVHALVAQQFFNGPTTSGTTLFVDGNMVGSSSTSTINNMFDGTAPLTLGSFSDVSNFRAYNVWLAFFDDPALAITDQKASDWARTPTQRVITGASRYYEWGPDGSYAWPSGMWAETGVSTGKTPGQFDMKFSGHPTYRKRAGWNPILPEIKSHWKTGVIPTIP